MMSFKAEELMDKAEALSYLHRVAVGFQQAGGDLAPQGDGVHRLELREALENRQVGAQRIAIGAGRENRARGTFDGLHGLAQKYGGHIAGDLALAVRSQLFRAQEN